MSHLCPPHKGVIQVRARRNLLPGPVEQRIIRAWAASTNLRLTATW
jgi:hypothetical protein